MSIIDRLSEKLFLADNGCWEFVGATTSSGYGNIWYEGKWKGAHVISYQLAKGVIPNGMLVCHTCDNKVCCNPDHLFLGTHQDNSDDMISKGRGARGVSISNAKLKEVDVWEIRRLLAQGYTLANIAHRYNISPVSVWNIENGVTWSHLQ